MFFTKFWQNAKLNRAHIYHKLFFALIFLLFFETPAGSGGALGHQQRDAPRHLLPQQDRGLQAAGVHPSYKKILLPAQNMSLPC